MKQRNAIIAVWMALFVAIGSTLLVSAANVRRDNNEVLTNAAADRIASTTIIRPWPEAIEVRLFVQDLSYEEQARTGASMSNPKGVVLTADQRATLDGSMSLYRIVAENGEITALDACFVPHHFFRYYDKNGKQLGELAVCYCCRQIRPLPALRTPRDNEFWDFDFDGVGKMLEGMNIPTNVRCDR